MLHGDFFSNLLFHLHSQNYPFGRLVLKENAEDEHFYADCANNGQVY